ncbi:major facilitator superfamily domain-containing protein [Syncephalis fuscata]|nr:major facilitator superfamily domain-containing protein [Syncephalis fuscata]
MSKSPTNGATTSGDNSHTTDVDSSSMSSSSSNSSDGIDLAISANATEVILPRESTPLPTRQLIVICCARFGEPVSFTMLFPFVYFVNKRLHMTDDQKEIGYYVGFLASSFAVAQFFSGLPWGYLSDQIGRRPVIMAGLLGTTICSLLFGLSTSFAWAITVRIMAGLLNGNIGVVKSMVGEITDATNQARAFSFLPMVYGMGCIVGPTIGGLLSYPADKYPELFGDSAFLHNYPFFLPCAICACFTFIGFLLTLFCLEETLNSEKYAEKTGTRTRKHSTAASLCPSTDAGIASEISPLLGTSPTPNYTGNSGTGLINYKPMIHGLSKNNRNTPRTLESNSTNNHHPNASKKFIPSQCWAPIVAGGALAFQSIIFDEIFPIWAATPIILGGLNFSSNNIGATLSAAGVFTLFVQLFLFPSLERRFGPHRLFYLSMFAYSVVLFIFPSLSLLVGVSYGEIDPRILLWTCLILCMGWRITCSVLSFTSYNLLILESARGTGTLGTVNGAAMCAQSLARAIGPALGGILWSWSLQAKCDYPFNYSLTWNIAGCASLITAIWMMRTIPKKPNNAAETVFDSSRA